MSISKVFITTAVTTMLIAIAAAMTAATFPHVAVFATPLLAPGGNDTTTDITTTPPGTAGGGGQEQPIHITKHGTNSYVISGGSSSVGSFDTTYRVVGERSAVRTSEDLIITTITDDFRRSPTIGYVSTSTTTGTAQDATTTLPNPFATPEQITERITNDLRRVITEAENNTAQGQLVEIKCDFGMTLEEMRCHHNRLVGGAGGGGASETTAPAAP
jgi:hypothetical protein